MCGDLDVEMPKPCRPSPHRISGWGPRAPRETGEFHRSAVFIVTDIAGALSPFPVRLQNKGRMTLGCSEFFHDGEEVTRPQAVVRRGQGESPSPGAAARAVEAELPWQCSARRMAAAAASPPVPARRPRAPAAAAAQVVWVAAPGSAGVVCRYVMAAVTPRAHPMPSGSVWVIFLCLDTCRSHSACGRGRRNVHRRLIQLKSK